MTLEEAKNKRDQYKHLIGQLDSSSGMNIIDIVVVPNDLTDKFWDGYRRSDLTNDELIALFSADNYFVDLVYEHFFPARQNIDTLRGSLDVYLKKK